MIDREKVIGHLNDCMEASRRDNTWVFVRKDIVEDAIALLKEQDNCENCAIAIEDRQPIVRCKDCKWSKPEKVFKNVPTSKDMVRWCELITRYVDDDWFCADGVAKDINVLGKEGR